MITARAAVIALLLIGGCLPAPAAPPRQGYREAQFSSRLEYLRFCARYAMASGRCVD